MSATRTCEHAGIKIQVISCLAAMVSVSRRPVFQVSSPRTLMAAPPEPRMYRYVHWHSGRRGWVAQVPEGNEQVTLGLYATQLAAAKVVRKRMRNMRTLSSLTLSRTSRSPGSGPEPRKYRHVTWHRGGWVARTAFKQYLGRGRTQVAAAKLVQQHLGLTSLGPLLLEAGQQEPAMVPSSAFPHVSWHKPGRRALGRWQVQIGRRCIGAFKTQQEAVQKAINHVNILSCCIL